MTYHIIMQIQDRHKTTIRETISVPPDTISIEDLERNFTEFYKKQVIVVNVFSTQYYDPQ